MEVEEGESVEEADSEAESRLARKVANFGMAAGRYYTPRRIYSEEDPVGRASACPGLIFATLTEVTTGQAEARPTWGTCYD